MNEKQQGMGILAAVTAYLLWGILPLYWKLFEGVTPAVILAHRIVWSLVFMILVLLCMRQLGKVAKEIRHTFSHVTSVLTISCAAVLISINWFLFIFAVNSDRVIETSLGYYINPLINVLLATIFLKERLTRWELLSFLLATGGVITITVDYGGIPWIALGLALSFGLYGLIKKTVTVGVWAGLTIETLLMTPFAMLFLLTVGDSSSGHLFESEGVHTVILLLGAGIVTAVPLLLFATGAKRISFSLIGFLQYIAPTIMLFLGVFLFHEPFSQVKLFSFILIWIGLVIFTTSRSRASLVKKKKATLAPEKAPLGTNCPTKM
ncbi:EamA family transporter RarD [Desmospora activa]|uniref:Chloramphenicol-sensitive protein RarD n=1 Tax=Desmospora activa DSM 45169 TaxID=1121389 RepID=A0A2T4Z0T0_9BACL|nr:EamA family transporter RarD [Desmospora activa]PTM53325.1 chloramphenicol-sensitive protein RarD [Desmospora activa DSM 45169]